MAKTINELTPIDTPAPATDYLIIEDVSETTSESTKKVLSSAVRAFTPSSIFPIETKTYADDATLTVADMGKILLINVTAASKTITLPPQAEGLNVFMSNVGANTFTLAPASGEKIITLSSVSFVATGSLFLLSNPGFATTDGWIRID